jgi:hypothetical protein
MTVNDIGSAAGESYQLGSAKPLMAEGVRQGFAWGGGIVGTIGGALTGAVITGGGSVSFTLETGPLSIGAGIVGGGTGAVVGGFVGNIGGSFGGYSLGDWLADSYIHKN